jgi:hypothetical protein
MSQHDDFSDLLRELRGEFTAPSRVAEICAQIFEALIAENQRVARAAQVILSHHDEGARPDQIALDELRAALKETI